MLNKKDLLYLKSQSNKLNATITIGKDNINENIIENIKKDLAAHELVKINVLKTATLDIKEAALDLASATNSILINCIGRSIVLYKESNKHIFIK